MECDLCIRSVSFCQQVDRARSMRWLGLETDHSHSRACAPACLRPRPRNDSRS